MSIASVAILFVGFAPSFYLKPIIQAPPPLSMLTIAHGVVGTLWMALFIAQAAFISTGRPALHRQMGMMGALLFGLMAMLGFWTAITAGKLGHAPPESAPPLAFMALPLIGMAASLLLVALALWNRSHSDWHKRLMLAALFSITGPGVGRIAIPLGAASWSAQAGLFVPELLLAVAMVYDQVQNKRVHPAYWYAAAILVTTHIAVTWAFTSPTWLAFAQTLTQSE
ncbi:MAG: hypothetical protein K8S25_16265 [Alphaproteobacteria bacterium]|nr:hypothetical protein [Alphaproteobacteria bacterium]